jgi:hypothetical protein
MTVTIVDQIMAFLTTDANRATFNTAIGLAAYTGKSFLRRYGVGGLQLDNVTLGTPAGFRLQQIECCTITKVDKRALVIF